MPVVLLPGALSAGIKGSWWGFSYLWHEATHVTLSKMSILPIEFELNTSFCLWDILSLTRTSAGASIPKAFPVQSFQTAALAGTFLAHY